jgi:hypothetical protein
MKTPSSTPGLTPLLLFSFAVALPACQNVGSTNVGASESPLIQAPASCGNGDPTCNTAVDMPGKKELNGDNFQNLTWNNSNQALGLTPGSASIVDTDGDLVPDAADECDGPGWRLPCDGDPSNDGIYQTLYFNADSDVTVITDVDITGKVQKADAYFLMDATGSMSGEQNNLVQGLTTGTFIDPTACPSAAGTGLLGALECVIPDLWIGVGDFKEVSYAPHNNRYDMAPYHHYLDVTNNVQHVLDAVSAFRADSNKDLPEATTQALYSVVTGQGLGDLVPNRAACPVAGHWGYPCFRPNILPIIVLITDADMWNGPVANGHYYGNPPFDGTLGLGTMLPPVEQSPNVLYSNDPFTAWDLGDLTNKSMTVMGSNVNLGNDAQTWDKGACQQCSWSAGCWSDGRDAFLKFSVSGLVDMSISGEGTAYHTVNAALFDGTLANLNCNPGPTFGGDYWGRFTQTLAAGDYYAVSDASVATNQSVSDRIGNFQLRFHNLTAHPLGDPSWMTADLPLTWTQVETALLASGVKIVNVVSPNSGGLIAIPDVTALAVATDSLDKDGNPFIEIINGDGSGLTTALLDSIRSLVGDTRRDISLVPEDNAATAINEADFVTAVTANSCPTNGVNNCLGSSDTDGDGTNDVCLGCLAETKVGFSFRLGNDFVAPTSSPQVFEFDMVAVADGSVELNRVPVRVMIPESGNDYGAGFYQNTYESETVCIMPPERPDWGTLTWGGFAPSDSTITFEFFTGDTLAELDTQVPVSIVYPADPRQEYDVGDELVLGGKRNWMPYLRVRARLQASSDSQETPILEGWSFQFNCVPKD